jgi:hypothetical protein
MVNNVERYNSHLGPVEFSKSSLANLGARKDGYGGIYYGEMKSGAYGMPHGRGIEVHRYGRIYIGEWVNGEPHGKGRMIQVDGKCFQGNWVDGYKHGEGISYEADGSLTKNEWELDKPKEKKSLVSSIFG